MIVNCFIKIYYDILIMSIKIPLNKLSKDERIYITQELQFQKKITQYNEYMPRATVRPFEIVDDDIYLPFYWGLQHFKGRCERLSRDNLSQLTTSFNGELRKMQKEVKKEVLSLLNNQGSCKISLYTGAGKTILSIYLSCKIKLKTLVIVNRLILIEQWKCSIQKVCIDPKIQVLTAKNKIDKSCDFYIMNAENVSKRNRDDLSHIGFVIVDEIHLIATEKLSKSFLYTTPRYLVGLSATPVRLDGMDILLDIFFGEKKIYRKLFIPHFVFKVSTGFKPEFTLNKQGKIDWNSVLNSQAFNNERNDLILHIVQQFPERVFLILTKRVKHGEYLVQKLQERGEDVTSLIGIKQVCNYDSRILVATVQKAGVGFDHPRLDALLLASDVENYFIQYLGRVMRREDSRPIIFDLVDKNSILEKHYHSRRAVYKNHGGTFKRFKKT
jgi:superfamily II DNA or RNA helicase